MASGCEEALPSLRQGDYVRMRGQSCVGEIVEITSRHARVAFGAMEASISLTRIEKVLSVTVGHVSAGPVRFPAVRSFHLYTDTLASFSTEIDLHGMSVSTALNTVDQWLDKAFLLGRKQLKIIHGKGAGILRKAVRTRLQSHTQVKRVMTQHPCANDGVTFLEMW